jgi:hypothetical protein
MSDDNKPYEVGYKKPPKKSQFAKGKSGNPKGRPPKELFHNVFIDAMNDEVTITVAGKKVTMSAQEVLIKKLFQDAMQGKQPAIRNFIEILKNLPNIPPV